MKFSKVLLSMFFYCSISFGQIVDCNDYKEYIKKEANKIDELNNRELHSSWLYKVEAYIHEEALFVFSTVKNKNGEVKKTYMYCYIPPDNWDRFLETTGSYGKSFHKYFEEYKCDCKSY